MRCAKCGADNKDGAKFCEECGASLDNVEFNSDMYKSEDTVQCPKCGYRNIIGSELCANCTEPLPRSSAPSEKKGEKKAANPHKPKKSEQKKGVRSQEAEKRSGIGRKGAIFIALIVIAAALVFVISSLSGSSDDGFTFVKTAYHSYYSESEGKNYVFSEGDMLDGTIDGEVTGQVQSLDGSVLACVTGTDSGKTLYLTKESGVIKLAADVGSYALSANGASLLYVSSVDAKSGAGNLICYDTLTDTPKNIDKTACEILAVSPGGDSYIYSHVDGTDGSFSLRLIVAGESSDLESEIEPVALTDGAEYIYFLKGGNLYARKGNADMKLGSCDGDYHFTADLSEVVFSAGGKYYFSCGGKEKTKLCDAKPEFVLDERCEENIPFLTNDEGKKVDSGLCVEPFDSFAGKMFVCDNSLWLIDENYSAQKLFGQCAKAVLSGSKYVFCLSEDNALSYFKAGKPDTRSVISANVMQFYLFSNGKELYYIAGSDNKGQLMYMELGEAAEKIASDVSCAALSDKDRLYYVVSLEGKSRLLRADGDEPELLREDTTDQLVYSDCLGNVYVRVMKKDNKNFDLYYLKSKSKLVCIKEGF